MRDAGTLLGLAPVGEAKADGRENSAQGGHSSPSNQPLTMSVNTSDRCKRCATGRPMSLIGSAASDEPRQIPDLIGSTRIAGQRRGRVGPQFSISDRICAQRRCNPWFQPRYIEKGAPRPHSLKSPRLIGLRGGVA